MYQDNPLGQLAAFALCVVAGAAAAVGITCLVAYREKVAVAAYKKKSATSAPSA